jgi:hypothetical protein
MAKHYGTCRLMTVKELKYIIKHGKNDKQTGGMLLCLKPHRG